MKLANIKKTLCAAVTVIMAAASIPTITVNAADDQKTGSIGGFDWEMWNQNYTGTVSMQPSAGSFTCSWSGIENFLARMGKNYDSQKKNYKAFGDIVLNYDVEYTPKGNSYMCIYGWTRNPLMEYYIVEGWGDWRPPGNDGEKKGTCTIDGKTYDILKSMRYNQPSIEGTKTFPQYWSVRTTSGSRNNTTNYMKDKVSVTQHFDAWSKAGLDMSGTLYEVSLNIEGYRSNGSANVKSISFGASEEITDPVTPVTVEPDADGYYFKNDFENGVGDWGARGGATVKSGTGYDGSKGVSVSGRTQTWNGVELALDSSVFKAGSTYSFGTAVMQDSEASASLKLTLQYTANGKTNYDEVALETAEKGKWTDLSNSSFTIPAGAENISLYVEAPDDLIDFYIDGAYAGVKGTKPYITIGSTSTPDPTEPTPAKGILGDLNDDGKVNVYDLVAMRKAILGVMSGGGKAPANSDVNGDGGVSVADLLLLQKFLLGQNVQFKEYIVTTTTTTTTKPITTTTTTSTPVSGKNYNAAIRNDMPTSVPGGVEKSSQCKVENKTYMCKYTGKNKKCNVILPPNYNPSKKYPVMYVLHGIMGSENDMVSGMGVQELMTGLMSSGKAEEFIVVTPNMFTSKTMNSPSGINQQTCAEYDNFLYDISDSLIPFIEQNYSVKTGRENRAITGFSMGGREAIYCGLMRPDLFGYVGGACPAPGITPGSDMFMQHPGCMKESEMKFRNVGPEPGVFMITGGTNDTVVGTFPKQYSDILTRNGVDHAYQSIPGGGHGAECVKPHLYTFMRYAFK